MLCRCRTSRQGEWKSSTDLQMQAQILSYSRSRGLFAGVTVNGSVIKEDVGCPRVMIALLSTQ